MIRFTTLFAIALFCIAVSASAQLTTPFKAKEGLATAQTMANTAGKNMEVYIIGTASQTFSGISISFDMQSGKATAWLYVFRSKDTPDTVKAYGVVKVPILGFQAMEIPYGDIAAMIPIDPQQSLNGVNYMDSDLMLNAMKSDSKLSAAISEDANIKLSYGAVAINPIPPYVVGDPYWAAVFVSKYKRVQCVLNAKTGAIDCMSEKVSAEDGQEGSKAQVFPNPAASVAFVTIPKSIQSTDYSFGIFDETGNKITNLNAPTSGEAETVSFSLESLPSGVYFFVFKSAKGEFSEKLVVSK